MLLFYTLYRTAHALIHAYFSAEAKIDQQQPCAVYEKRKIFSSPAIYTAIILTGMLCPRQPQSRNIIRARSPSLSSILWHITRARKWENSLPTHARAIASRHTISGRQQVQTRTPSSPASSVRKDYTADGYVSQLTLCCPLVAT